MMKKRRQYSAAYKFKVALEAAKGSKTLVEVAKRDGCASEQQEATLYEQIGRLTVELGWLKKTLPASLEAERQRYLGSGPYQRSPQRQGQANGYKPKTVQTRVGEITFAVPRVRKGEFYPQALEKGLCSERALCLALAEMCVQGVSTRKVAAITEQLCGTQLSSSQVGRAAGQLGGDCQLSPFAHLTYSFAILQ